MHLPTTILIATTSLISTSTAYPLPHTLHTRTALSVQPLENAAHSAANGVKSAAHKITSRGDYSVKPVENQAKGAANGVKHFWQNITVRRSRKVEEKEEEEEEREERGPQDGYAVGS
ncbi:hypothetical protein ACLMJK_002213 [Lecanora helva]